MKHLILSAALAASYLSAGTLYVGTDYAIVDGNPHFGICQTNGPTIVGCRIVNMPAGVSDMNGIGEGPAGILYAGNENTAAFYKLDYNFNLLSAGTGGSGVWNNVWNEDFAGNGTELWRVHYDGVLQQINPDTGAELRRCALSDSVGAAFVGDKLYVSKYAGSEVGIVDRNASVYASSSNPNGQCSYTTAFKLPAFGGGLAYDSAAQILWVGLVDGTLVPYDLSTNLVVPLAAPYTVLIDAQPHIIDGLAFVADSPSTNPPPGNSIPQVKITGPTPGAVYPVGIPVGFTGTFIDPDTSDTHTARWGFDGLTAPGTVSESNGSGTVGGSYTFTSPGVYQIVLDVTDQKNATGEATTINGFPAMVVIYDPNGGFVTGGGWIDSPAGAYTPNPSLTGRANFGFVAKYQRGATVPTGETEFQFKLANLNFHSTAYEWLVVAGARAQYKGSGTINGTGDYGFLLTMIDGQISGGGGLDRFRIKIWDKSRGDGSTTAGVIYDNQIGQSDTGDATTVLAGGSIVIHQ